MGRIYGRATGWAYIEQWNAIIRVKIIPGGCEVINGVPYLAVKPYEQIPDSGYFLVLKEHTATTKKVAAKKLTHLLK